MHLEQAMHKQAKDKGSLTCQAAVSVFNVMPKDPASRKAMHQAMSDVLAKAAAPSWLPIVILAKDLYLVLFGRACCHNSVSIRTQVRLGSALCLLPSRLLAVHVTSILPSCL